MDSLQGVPTHTCWGHLATPISLLFQMDRFYCIRKILMLYPMTSSLDWKDMLPQETRYLNLFFFFFCIIKLKDLEDSRMVFLSYFGYPYFTYVRFKGGNKFSSVISQTRVYFINLTTTRDKKTGDLRVRERGCPNTL